MMGSLGKTLSASPTPQHPLKRKKKPPSSPAPRVLACHDFKGGYGDDALACGVFSPPSPLPPSSSRPPFPPPAPSPFRFTHWNSVDAFVYFSHSLVTIPPPGWTDAAHDGGALVLGTLIFEHSEGLREAERAFGTAAAAKATAAKLAELSRWFGFDGWLFNVEVAFEKGGGDAGRGGEEEEDGEEEEEKEEQEEEEEEEDGRGARRTRALVDNCALCLRRTRELCRRVSSSSSSLVLWYDAVTCDDGSLRWQNGLTERNARFFEAADGIFTNYCWKGSSCLRASARLAEEGCKRSAAEVWVGADAFGRGSFGGEGSAGVAAAAAAAATAGASLAVFAPGWVSEAFEGAAGEDSSAAGAWRGAWRARADEFWRGVDQAYRGRRRKRRTKERGGSLRLPLFSAFSTGAGAGWWSPSSSSSSSRPSARSRRVGGSWFSLGLADSPCPASQRWGAVSVALGVAPVGEREGAAAVRLSLVVAEAAVVRAGAGGGGGGGDCEVGGRCSSSSSSSCCCRLASRHCSFDGGGALAVAVSAFGPAAGAGAASGERRVEFELFGGGESGGESGGGGKEGAEEVVAVRAWVSEEGHDAAAASPAASPTASPAAAHAAAVSLSLVVRGCGGDSTEAAPPPSLLLPLDSSAPRASIPPPLSSPSSPPPSASSSCRWRKHERSFSLREFGGRVSSVSLRLSFVPGGGEEAGEGGGGEGAERAEREGGGGRRRGRPLFAATLGAVALVPSSFRPPESPVASWIALRGRALEWGCERESEGDGDGPLARGSESAPSPLSSSKVKRWEVWRRRGGGEPSFLGATRAQRWFVSGDGDDEDDSLRRGDEVFVRAVFADGGREALEGVGVAAVVE